MRQITGVFCFILAGLGGAAVAESLLEPASFPKTVNDVPFIDRLFLMGEGYDDFDTVFDENGVCVAGCAYKGIKMENMIEASERATKKAAAKFELYKLQHPEEFAQEQTSATNTNTGTQANNNTNSTATNNTGNTANNTNTSTNTNNTSNNAGNIATQPTVTGDYKCPTNQWSKYIPKGRAVVDHAPLDTNLVVVSDIGPRNVSNGSKWHQGLDLRAVDGVSIYLPANGIVTAVTGGPSSTAGYYIWVYHPTEQIYTRYLHLSQQLVKQGDHIMGGCLIAKSGHSGTGKQGKPYAPHLHYEIKKTQTNYQPDVIDPFGNGLNRLGRDYKFKTKSTISPLRNGATPVGCNGFL